MDQELKNLQDIWQARKITVPDTAGLIKQLQKIDKRARFERYIMLFSAPLTTLFLLWVLPVLESPYSLTAVALIGSGMYMVLRQADKARSVAKPEAPDFSNLDFVETQIARLRQLIRIASRYMWIYTFMLMAGINLAYIDVLARFPLDTRLLIHLLVSAAILLVMYIGIKRRLRKYDKEIVPLIDSLESIRQQLKNSG